MKIQLTILAVPEPHGRLYTGAVKTFYWPIEVIVSLIVAGLGLRAEQSWPKIRALERDI